MYLDVKIFKDVILDFPGIRIGYQGLNHIISGAHELIEYSVIILALHFINLIVHVVLQSAHQFDIL